MPKIETKLKDGERIDNALRRFRKVVEKSGVLQELRKREYFEKPSVKKKRKQKLTVLAMTGHMDARQRLHGKKVFRENMSLKN